MKKKFIYIYSSCIILIPLIISFSILLYYWQIWDSNKNFYSKETEIYYNTLMRMTHHINKYQFIGTDSIPLSNIYPIKIYDRNKNILGSIETTNKIILPLEKVSKNFLISLIATEDKNFYKHNGVSISSILRAFMINLRKLKIVEGGSTITQQLVKILFTKQERTIQRKFNEFFTALNIEKYYTKNDILLMYTNLIYFGYNIQGIGLASKAYFNKEAKDLSIEESTLLVSMIPNPTLYNPYKHLLKAKKRHLQTLLKMAEENFFSKETAILLFKKYWKNPTLLHQVNFTKESSSKNYAPYIVEEVRRFLIKQYGENYAQILQGSNIYTTIDLNLQVYGQNYIRSRMNKMKKMSYLKAKDKRNIESAYVISSPKTGEILSFVGGNDYLSNNQLNRAFQSRRQIGSTVKPFLYLVGLNLKQITPYTVFDDLPLKMNFGRNRFWEVSNDSHSYRGSLNVIDALKRSSNVIAVQVANKIGLENLEQYFQDALNLNYSDARKMFPHYQYSIALGALELTPLELNQLYQVIANDGILKPLYFISRIQDLKGKYIYEKNTQEFRKIVSRESSFLIKGILKQVMQPGGSGSRVQREFHFTVDIAGKSGTTQKNRDVWFAGFTNSLVTTVWIGQDQDKPLGKNFYGGIQAGSVFGQLMKNALNFYPTTKFSADASYNFIKSPIDLLTGNIPNKNSLFVTQGLLILGTEPKKISSLSKEQQLNIAMEKKLITPNEKEKILKIVSLEEVKKISPKEPKDMNEDIME